MDPHGAGEGMPYHGFCTGDFGREWGVRGHFLRHLEGSSFIKEAPVRGAP